MGDSPSALEVSAGTQDSKDWKSSNDDRNKSLETAESCARIEDLKYLYASNVNVSNFVSEKLSGDRKYHVWKAQMVCLMETHKMHGIVDPKFVGPGATDADIVKQYDNLLRGWIFGSLSEDVLSTVVDLDSARAVWKKLKSIYDPEKSSTQDSASPQPLTQIEIVTVTETENKDNIIRNKKLRKAMVEGRWWEAEAILKKAATEAINNKAGASRRNPEKAAIAAISDGVEAILKNPEKEATEAVRNGSDNIWKNLEKAATKAVGDGSENILKKPEKAVSNGAETSRKTPEKAATDAINNGAETSWKKSEKEATEAINNEAGASRENPEKAATVAISNDVEAIMKNPEREATKAASNGAETSWKSPEKEATDAINNGAETSWKKSEKEAIEATNNIAEAIRNNLEKAATASEAISNRAENILKNSEKANTDAISNGSEAIWKNHAKAATEAVNNEAENIRKIPEKAATEAISDKSENMWRNHKKEATKAAIEVINNGSENTWKNTEKTATEAINNSTEAIRKFPEITVTEAIGNKAEAVAENAEKKTATEAETMLKTAKKTAMEAEAILKTAKQTAMEAEAILESAREGMDKKAKAILRKAKKAATEAISNDGNTMLHLAVGIGQNNFVEKLLDFIDDGKEIEKQNSDGRTALHIAAIVGNKHAAELLVKKRKELLGISDYKAYVPLLSAYYNMQLNTFVYLMEAAEIKQQALPLGLLSGSGFRTGVNLLITAIFTKQYNLASTLVNIYPELATKDDQVLKAMARTFPSELGFGERLMYPSLNNVIRKIVKRCSSLFYSYEFLCASAKDILWAMRRFKSNYYSALFPEMILTLLVPAAIFYPIYQLIRLFVLLLFYPFFVLYFLLWKVLATVVAPIKCIEKKKKDYKEAKEILKLVCDEIDKLSFSGPHHPCYSRPILEAACQGAYEVVDEILFRSPKAIDCKNQNGLNIIQLAVVNRSEKVYNLIYHIVERKDFYRTVMDSSKNNILHLAGRLAPSRILNRTTGAALQLQRELQWREELEKFVFPAYITEENIFKETPEMVFTREHENLVKEGEKWMKTTAESCSITAALITTIVFAAAITVPGGSNQETGIPMFKGTVAFTVFAVSDAISLFASATALLVFLSILTARFSEQDFLVSLPRRLIIGLCTLFLSTTMMMIAFSATLFLVFVDQRKWMLGPIGGLTCLPIVAFVTLQFPLVVDLFRSTYFPIFGKQSYIEHGKFNPNNIQYFFGNRGIEYVLE